MLFERHKLLKLKILIFAAMLDKLQSIKIHWEELAEKLSDPELVKDMNAFMRTNKEYKDLGVIVKAYEAYENVLSNINFNKEVISTEKDEEMRDMAKGELSELEEQKLKMEDNIKQLLIPKDPEDEKNIIVEIRAGTGGDEAGIFVGDIYRMYMRYCDNNKFKTELLGSNESSSGGFKEISFSVSGEDVYGTFKYESGVHRVQRVPATESQGRVHTSAVSVAILPEADEVDVVINPADLRIDTYRASGAGGQHVNKTESAVRIVHVPTGVVAECQDGRSQIKNKETAMKMLRSKMYEAKLKEHNDAIANKRKTLVSTGDRSAKIRTYNYPQGRVTDHRINLTLYHLDSIMNGDIQHILDELRLAENAEKMKEGGLA